ncbi:hypothetical protein RJ640_007710 [Escallonia rubra]|uniref:Uncharacterized protein n=1 Tax=Escallonia rubra TaxID=112253 RepID=A0AA88RGA5_9ASTE|nr:hypothetical protein RJ640_007710 [Escallonia rubra]
MRIERRRHRTEMRTDFAYGNVEKFDGSNDFSLWRMKMCTVLIQQGLLKALKGNQGLPETMSADEKEDIYVAFDESLMLLKKEELIDAGKDHGARTQRRFPLDFKSQDARLNYQSFLFRRETQGMR